MSTMKANDARRVMLGRRRRGVGGASLPNWEGLASLRVGGARVFTKWEPVPYGDGYIEEFSRDVEWESVLDRRVGGENPSGRC